MRETRAQRNDGKLIKSDAPVPVGDGRNAAGRENRLTFSRINHDEIIAKPVHFHEGQGEGVCSMSGHIRLKPRAFQCPGAVMKFAV